MGGMGSGRYSYGSRDTVENCREIDIRCWQRDGLLPPGRGFNWQWASRGEVRAQIGVRVEHNAIRLIYRARRSGEDWQDVDEQVLLTYTGCNYGGQRVWFACPGCGRRVAKLNAGGIHYACRHCYRLPFASQGETVRDRQIREAGQDQAAAKGRSGHFKRLAGQTKRNATTRTISGCNGGFCRARKLPYRALWIPLIGYVATFEMAQVVNLVAT